MLQEERIFLELMKMPDGRVSIMVGGGSFNDGIMISYDNIENAIEDIRKRAVLDYMKLKQRSDVSK